MLDKGFLISMAFLRLGKNNEYNDNKSLEYKVANKLIDHVFLNMAKDTAYLFNSTTVTLTLFKPDTNVIGEYRANVPNDMLNVIRADKPIRLEGEFIYSNDNEIHLQYCRAIDISDTPEYLSDLLIYTLCREMCLAFNSYYDRLGYFEQKIQEERLKVIANQFNNFKFPIG